MDRITKKFVSFLCENNIVEEDNKELYEYAANLLFSGILHFATTVATGLLFGMVKESLLMFTAFFIVRKFAGGFHASSPAKCYIFSVVTNFLMLSVIAVLSKNDSSIAFYVILSLSELIIILSPVLEPPEKALNFKEKKVYKALSVALSALIAALAVLIYQFVAVNYGVSLCIGLAMAAAVLCLALLFSKAQKGKKESPAQI